MAYHHIVIINPLRWQETLDKLRQLGFKSVRGTLKDGYVYQRGDEIVNTCFPHDKGAPGNGHRVIQIDRSTLSGDTIALLDALEAGDVLPESEAPTSSLRESAPSVERTLPITYNNNIKQQEKATAMATAVATAPVSTGTSSNGTSSSNGITTVRFEGTDQKKVYKAIDGVTNKEIGLVMTDEAGYGIIINADGTRSARYWNRKTAGEALLAEIETGVRPAPATKGAGFLTHSPLETLLSELETRLMNAQTEQNDAVDNPEGKDAGAADYAAGVVDTLTYIVQRVRGLHLNGS